MAAVQYHYSTSIHLSSFIAHGQLLIAEPGQDNTSNLALLISQYLSCEHGICEFQ